MTAPEDGVAELCADLVRFDTTNYGDGEAVGERDAAEYVAELLAAAEIESTLLESAPGRANLIARIPGTDADLPPMLAHAHLDVVPARAEDWSVPPFAGEIKNGFVWGRGAIDMKDTIATLLSAVRSWAPRGVRPRRDVVLAFVADEEDHGHYGAEWLVDRHPELFADCAFAIGESGGYPLHADGTRLYPVATAERGTMQLRLTAHGRAGHGSRPNPDNAVAHLIRTLARLVDHRWPVRLTPTVRAYLLRAGEALGVEVDLDSDAGVEATVDRLGPAGVPAAATIRTTCAPTVLEAGYKVNVVPGTAHADLDIRTLPGSADEVLATVDDLLGTNVQREFLSFTEPVSAPIDSPWFAAMGDALRTEDPAAIVVPFCMGGGTDAKAFARLGIAGYGFSPVFLPAGFSHRGLAHGVDERVPVDGLRFGARVLDRFLADC